MLRQSQCLVERDEHVDICVTFQRLSITETAKLMVAGNAHTSSSNEFLVKEQDHDEEGSTFEEINCKMRNEGL